MGQVFQLAKAFVAMEPPEIEKLLDSEIHEVRAGALSIMDKQARRKRTPEEQRRELYELYRRRIDRIDSWDLVDLAAPFVVGCYLADRDRSALRAGALEEHVGAAHGALCHDVPDPPGEVDDTLAIAELMIDDEKELIHKAAGGCLRWAGDKHSERLRAFLDRHAARMPPTMLRHATEKLDKAERERYRVARSAV